jgi:hypothetical protein
MAEHKVQLPDNSVITIEGPDDATDQELIDAASKHYASKQNKPAASTVSQPVTAPTVESMTDSARHMNPMTYGAGAAAGVGVLAGAKLLKDKFFGAEKPGQSIERIEPQMDVSQKKPSEPFLEPETQTVRPTDWESSLSAEDRQLLERSRANAAVKASQPAPVATSTGGNVVPQAQIPAAAQPAPVVPPAPVVEAPVNPKLPALFQPPAGAAPPSVIAPAIAEPVATPVLPTTPIKTDNPLITAAQAAPVSPAPTEVPAAKATLEQQVKAIKETATPIATPEKQPPAKAPPKPKMKLPEGWGKGMSWLTTVHGVDGARAFIDQYNDGKPFATHKEMDDKYREVTIRPKYSDIPKDIRKDRRIPLRTDLTAVPPPSLRPNEIGQGGGSLIRSLTDPLQLKQ